MISAFLTAILFPMLAPLAIHALSPLQEGLVVVRTRKGRETSTKKMSTFMAELPMALFANSVWGMTYSFGNLFNKVVYTWSLVFFGLAALEIILRVRIQRKQTARQYYLMLIGMAALALAATTVRIVNPYLFIAWV